MAARSKTAITTEARQIVAPYHINIEGTDNPGDLGPNRPTATTPLLAILVVLLLILEVLLNIRQSETT